MLNIKHVTMGLTDIDDKNTEKLRAYLNLSNKASAISVALSVTNKLTDYMKEGSSILVKNKDGSMQELYFERQ
ncbi:MAG: hypothetical protein H7839_17305 [Magnetococcus sp. YQC-5]